MKVKNIGSFELLMTFIFGFLYLVITLLMIFDTVSFYKNPEIYSKVHHLNREEPLWEWKYLKSSLLYVILSLTGLFVAYKVIKVKSLNWRKMNLILMLLFVTSVAIGYFQWYSTGFDH